MPFNKVLVTLDGSPTAENALAQARLALRPGGHITLLAIAEDTWTPSLAFASASGIATPLPPMTGAEPLALLDGQLRHYLEHIAEPFVHAGYEVTCDVRHGNVVDVIVEEAGHGYDLLVMSTHGRTGFRRMLLGSVVADVLPLAPCPVLVVPPQVAAHHDATENEKEMRPTP